MKIKYDKKNDTKYILIKKGKVFSTKEKKTWFIVDYAKDGSVLGIEILNASRHQIAISTISNEFSGYYEIESTPEENQYKSLSVKVPVYKLNSSLAGV